jgi:hypothetical protein
MPHSPSSEEAYGTDDDRDEDYTQTDGKNSRKKIKKSRRSSTGSLPTNDSKSLTYKDLRLGFSLFQIQKRKEITESVPEEVRKEQHWFMKAASRAWKALSQTERSHYNDISALEISKIHSEKAKRKKAGKQKKVSGYQMYLAEQMKLGRDKRTDHQQWVKAIGAKWRNMSDEDRASYNEEASRRNEEYEKQYQALLESIEDGNEDIADPMDDHAANDITINSSDEEQQEEEELTPKRKKRKRTRISASTKPAAEESPATPKKMYTAPKELHAKSVSYMNTLIQARLNDVISSEEYNTVKPFIITKADSDELGLLMDLFNSCLAGKAKQMWAEKNGTAFLNSVIQLLSMPN